MRDWKVGGVGDINFNRTVHFPCDESTARFYHLWLFSATSPIRANTGGVKLGIVIAAEHDGNHQNVRRLDSTGYISG